MFSNLGSNILSHISNRHPEVLKPTVNFMPADTGCWNRMFLVVSQYLRCTSGASQEALSQ